MKLNELPSPNANNQEPKRVGRGIGSGHGKTSCRGMKGQKARSGGYHKLGFEGGQQPLQRRLPKRGFTSPFKKHYALVKIGDLDRFEANSEIRVDQLKEAGVVGRRIGDGVKLLADGELNKPLTLHVDKASQAAIAKVEAAGGKVIVTAGAAESE